MRRTKRFITALLVAAVLATAASRVVQAATIYSGWYYDVGWWWPFSYCFWTYVDYGNGSWWYSDTCGVSYGYMSLN